LGLGVSKAKTGLNLFVKASSKRNLKVCLKII